MSCSEDTTSSSGSEYGYVQFTLSKASTRTEQLDYLGLASKVRVDMITTTGEHLSQTLNVNAKNDQTAELGMQSDKWMLYVGEYKVAGYELFDKLDNPLITFNYNAEEYLSVQITPGGISMQNLSVAVKGRGHVQLRLIKDNAVPDKETRVNGVKKYPFHMIKSVDVDVKCLDDNKVYKFTQLDVEYKVSSSEIDPEHITGVSVCDSLISLPAGAYQVISYKTFFDTNRTAKLAEYNKDVVENSFVVTDNRTTQANVPVTLDEAADYIKDAYNLREIWLALDGPNWSYRGITYPKGTNWVFDGRDIDLWLAQPGVKVLETGRIAFINFEGFGPKGEMPAALGELAELRQLYLGNHNSEPGYSAPQASPAASTSGLNIITETEIERSIEAMRTSFMTSYCSDGRSECSDEMMLGFSLNGIDYKTKQHPTREFPRHSPVNYVTQITSLDKANIGNLKNLQALYIAYSLLKTLPADIVGCESLTDLEIFACPDMEEFPKVIAELPKLKSLTFSINTKVSSEAMTEGLRYMNEQAGKNESSLQTLYLPAQSIKLLPDLRNLKKLGLLNIQSCGIEKIETAFGKDHFFVQFLAPDNKLSSLPTDADGYFVGLHSNFEGIDFSYNEFEELPNIFNAESIYSIESVSFANNKISRLQGADNGSWRGIKVKTLSLGYNKFTEVPYFFNDTKTCSIISFLQMPGNGIETFSEEALKGDHDKVVQMISLDLSRNKLTELPDNFNAATLPYLFGLDLSYNRFESFQFKPLNCSSLTTYIFRGQRDAKGNRCMKQWPTGIGKHTGLRALFLGSNDIRKMTDLTLSYLIFNFEIIDNPNITIDVSSVCSYIKARRYFLVYDADQDIRGCDDGLVLNK